MANSLQSSIRRGRITAADITGIESKLKRLRIHRAQTASIHALLEVAQRYNLSAYDAAYILLATQTGASIATFDSRMRTATKLARLNVIPEEEASSAS